MTRAEIELIAIALYESGARKSPGSYETWTDLDRDDRDFFRREARRMHSEETTA